MKELSRAFAFEDANKPAEAEREYLTILRREPKNATALFNLGRLYSRYKVIDKAVEMFGRVKELGEHMQATSYALGHSLLDQGQTAEAINTLSGSDKLFAACHSDDAEQCERLHKEWAAGIQLGSEPMASGHKVAWVSPNFRRHTVPKFALPAVGSHDYIYSDVVKPDEVTERFKRFANWRDVSGMDDAQLLEQMKRDGISYAIDLTGHMDGGKRAAFFAKLSRSYNYVGYCRGTGVPKQIRITDNIIDPLDVATDEQLIRVAGGCYGYAGEESLAVADRGAERSKPKIYGSINRPAKFTDCLLAAWGRIINADPAAKLLALVPGGETNRQLRGRMEAAGIPAERLQLVPTGSGEHYAAFVRGCDLILDSFAYSGMTTTADALWLGVPVVTLLGRTPQGRVGGSILRSAGISHWIAASVDEYEKLATEERHWLRGEGLRQKLRGSNLCNGSIALRLRAALFNQTGAATVPPPARAAVAGSSGERVRDRGTRGGCGCGKVRG